MLVYFAVITIYQNLGIVSTEDMADTKTNMHTIEVKCESAHEIGGA
jgi:hypothetical protein